jgi:hypothetical protein
MRLTDDQIQVVRKEAERYKAAVTEAGKAQVALWQARIDVALAVGDFDLSDLTSPVASNWNCNCAFPTTAEEMTRGWRK